MKYNNKSDSSSHTAKSSNKNKKNRQAVVVDQSSEAILNMNKNKNSEAIVNILIRKLITSSVRKSHISHVEQQIGQYCFNGSKQFFSNITQMVYIDHDEDDSHNWLTINHPFKPSVDRSISNYIPMINESKQQKKSITETVSIASTPVQRQDQCPSMSSRRLTTFRSPSLSTTNLLKEMNKDNDIDNNANAKTKEKQPIPIDLVIGDINNINHRKESEEIIKLRRDKLLEMNSQEEEEQKKKNRLRRLAEFENLKNSQLKFNKPFSSDNLTFDTNGDLIQLKKVNIDSLSNDFSLLKVNVKEYKNKSDSIHGVGGALKNHQSQLRSQLPTQVDIQSKEDQLPYIANNNNSNSKDFYYRNQPHRFTHEKTQQLYPAGNNFDKIIPTTGVIIKELNKSKSGDMNFHSKYNKYSEEEYKKISSCYSTTSTIVFKGLNHPPLTQEKLESNDPMTNIKDNNDNNTIEGDKSNENNTLNQKLNSKILSLHTTKRSGFLFNFKKATSPLLSEDNRMLVKNMTTMSLMASLDSSDNTSDAFFYQQYRNKMDKKAINTKVNLFKTTTQNSQLLSNAYSRRISSNDKDKGKGTLGMGMDHELNNINQFNKQLLTQKAWGANHNQGYLSPLIAKERKGSLKHPTKTNFKNEIDSKIRDIRMPRERKFHKSVNKSKTLFIL